MARKRRNPRTVPNGTQAGFGFAGTSVGKRLRQAPYPEPLPSFEDPRGTDLVLNGLRLEDYLAADFGWVIDLHGWLLRFDWSEFEKAYKPSGRRPIHPRIIVGLVLFGALIGCRSLRELEDLAKRDLGAWFICGGLRPDHSTVGKVLFRHLGLLGDSFFEKATHGLLLELQIKPGGKGAIDGTVIQAAASRFATMSRDAVREAAKAAQAEVERLFAAAGMAQPSATPIEAPTAPGATPAELPRAPVATAEQAPVEAHAAPVATPNTAPAGMSPAPVVTAEQAPVEAQAAPVAAPNTAPVEAPPDNAKPSPGPEVHAMSPELAAAIEKATLAQRVAEVAEARAAERAIKGLPAEKTSVAPGELDAVLQPLKRGGHAPAYKPSIVTHESGLIIAQAVHPSSETEVVPGLRDLYRRVLGGSLEVALLDGNYHCDEILRMFVDANEDVLCPGGHGSTRGRKGANGFFGKADFHFDEVADTYRCPAGQVLRRKCSSVDRDGRTYTTYLCSKSACATCPLHDQCTKAATRSVSRYSGDELKEAMVQVFTQPTARQAFRLQTS